ncbi:MAG: outer membrane beta-barrel protein [Ignavibacteria bacterium]|nr:outer membrane beta-barrel protein [Ignavibacteria bacterium]
MLKNILSSIFLSSVFLILFFSASLSITLFAQEELLLDSLITGSKYRITMYNEKEVIGKVIKQDTIYVYMATEEGSVRVRREDIFSVSRSTVPRLIKAMFSLGGGVYLQSGGYNSYREADKPGYTFNLSAAYPFSENKAVRVDLSYSRLKREPYAYSLLYYPYDVVYAKQNIDIYSVYVDFVFGDFNTNTDFSIYGIAGLGIQHTIEGEYEYSDYNYYDSTYINRTYPSYSSTFFSMAIGGGLRFKINNRIGAFAEAQYNMSTYGGLFLFFGRGYFPIRAGVTYSIY